MQRHPCGWRLLAFVIGGYAVYAWLRPMFGDWRAGWLGWSTCSSPSFFQPSTYIAFGRCAGAGLAAVGAVAGLGTSARHHAVEGAGVAVLAMIALWRTQAGLAVGATILLLAYSLLVERHWVPVLVTLTASAAGALTLLPLWSLDTAAAGCVCRPFCLSLPVVQRALVCCAKHCGWQDAYPFQLGFVRSSTVCRPCGVGQPAHGATCFHCKDGCWGLRWAAVCC